MYLTIKSSCPQKSTVKNIGPVCRCKNYHTHICSESVHFGQQLIESVFPFIIGTEINIFPPCPANRIYFINKHYTWCLLLCLLKQIPYPRCTHSNKHFNEIRS